MNLKKGDYVSIVDQDIHGIVVSVFPKRVAVYCSDGFIDHFSPKELIKQDNFYFPKLTEREIQNIRLKGNDFDAKKLVKQIRQKKEDSREVDLHIEQLVDDPKRLTPKEIIDVQICTAIDCLESSIKKKQKIVFIHGVGKGVLKEKLTSIFERYPNVTFQDGDFLKYGMGATEVHIH